MKDIKGKFIIVFDTICEGNQTGNDENGNPPLYNSYDEAFRDMFIDALCSIEGSEFYLDEAFEEGEDEKSREDFISEMNVIIKEDSIEKMKLYLSENPNANYHDEFVVKADEFILGRKAIFTGQGIVIEGTKLEDL